MIRLQPRCALLCILVLLLSPFAVFAQPLSDRVPGGSIIYLGWNGTNNLGANYEKSNLKAIIDASNFRQLLDETLPGVIQRVARDDKQAGEVLRIVSAVAGPVLRHPTAVYLEGVDWQNPRGPMPKLGLLCKAGADADSLLGLINTLVTQAQNDPNAPPIRAFRIDDIVAITLGYTDEKSAIASVAANALAASAPFRNALGNVQKEPVAVAYVDFEKLIGLIDHQVQFGGDEEAKQMWPKVREAFGLAGLKRFISTGAFDGADWMTQCFIDAPAPRPGLLTMLDREPASAELLKAIPRSATWFTLGRFDPAKLVREVRANSAKVDNLLPQIIDMGLGAAQLALSVNPQTDLLEALGDEWALFIDPSLAGRGPQGLVVVNCLRKPQVALRSLKRVELFAYNAANAALIRQKMRLTMERVQSGDIEIHYIQTPLFSPSWAIQGDNLIAALYPQTVAAVAAASGDERNSIVNNERFAALRKRLGVENASGLSFNDLPEAIEGSYPLVLALTQSAVGAADMMGVKTPAMVLPPLPTLRKHLTPAGSASWTDDKGWHMKSVTPFPFACLLSVDQTTLLMIGAMGAGAATQSHSVAAPAAIQNEPQSINHLRQIGVAAIQYANASRGQYPKDLGTLYLEGKLPVEVLVGNTRPVPQRIQEAPASLDAAQREEAAAWINASTPYVYQGANLRDDAPASAVVAYTKDPGFNGTMALLFADGHVELLPPGSAHEKIARTEKKTLSE